jgi:general secretion pathway protein J
MNYKPPTNAIKAFTLIEVLLAVSVFAIVLGAINSVFFSALRLRNKSVEAFERALPLQQALNFIQKDFEGIMIPGGRLAGTFTTSMQSLSNNAAFIGERVSPDIYTSSGNVSELARWADVQKVAYFLALPTNTVGAEGGKDLVRLVTRNLLPANVEEQELQHLMSGVESMRFQYYDGLAWADTSTSSNLPVGIKVQITLSDDYVGTTRIPAPVELVVPILVKSPSSSTEQADGGTP